MARIGHFDIECAAATDTGQQRSHNEDAYVMLDRHGVFCVADGVGGSKGSELASQAVVDALNKAFSPAPAAVDTTLRDPEIRVRHAIDEASRWIHEQAGHPDTAGMASTVVVLILCDSDRDTAHTLHAGDSRCYRLRNGHLECLTRDHSGAEMIGIRDENLVPEKYRHLITRAVGTHLRVNLEHTDIDVRQGDLFLLCSDGLNRMVSNSALRDLLLQGHRGCLRTLSRNLIQAANDAGGADNITVILVRTKNAEYAS